MVQTLILCFILFLGGCAGYRFQEKTNPFAQYGVKSISVPMFYNKSNFANISAPMTKEVYQMLSGFSGLKLVSGHQEADAVLIGIVMSPGKTRESRQAQNLRSAKNALEGAIGDERGDFYIPSTTSVNAQLRLILLRNPSEREIELLRSSLGKFAVGPKVIVNESLPLTGSFTRELYEEGAIDVIDTQNRSALKNTVNEMAQSAAANFKDMILYAF
ncbi:MAG: hypothetical protein WEB87_03360 [Bacteriovoracaceae bacterium]